MRIVLIFWIMLSALNAYASDDESRAVASHRLKGAAIEGWTKSAREAISQGADVNQSDEYSNTPLLIASIRGHDRVVEALLSAEAKVDIQNDDYVTAIFSAASNCNDRVVELLIRAGANVNLVNRTRQTPLMRAAENGCSVVVGLLLKAKGIKLRLRDDSGRDAFDYAREASIMGLDYGDSFALMEDVRRKRVVSTPEPVIIQLP